MLREMGEARSDSACTYQRMSCSLLTAPKAHADRRSLGDTEGSDEESGEWMVAGRSEAGLGAGEGDGVAAETEETTAGAAGGWQWHWQLPLGGWREGRIRRAVLDTAHSQTVSSSFPFLSLLARAPSSYPPTLVH